MNKFALSGAIRAQTEDEKWGITDKPPVPGAVYCTDVGNNKLGRVLPRTPSLLWDGSREYRNSAMVPRRPFFCDLWIQ